MDSRKPLTAGEIEELKDDVKIINEFLELCSHRLDPWNMARVADAVAWLGVDKGKIVDWVHGYWDGEDVERKMMDMEKENARLLSLLTPPPDAAVREAVEFFAAMDNDCVDRPDEVKRQADILCRAVQAPRLTGEQVDMLRKAGDMLDGLVDEYPGHRDEVDDFKSAFPEAFAGEVGKPKGWTFWTCGICGEKRPGSVKPVLDEECGDACPEHYEAGEVGRGM